MLSPYNLTMDIPAALYKSSLNILTSNSGRKPLWQTTNELHQEYFEVEILADRNEDFDVPLEKNLDILNINKYLCHICNIEVPKTYTKEHSNSVKHKICNEIANIALERTKLQIQLDIALPCRIEISDTYFCECCATVILNSDKETHETTKGHKISIRHDELLEELLKVYSDIDNVEVISEIDELELLQQKIESESLIEEIESQNRELVDAENLICDLKAEQGEEKLKSEMKTTLDIEFNSLDGMCNKSNALADKLQEYESNTLSDMPVNCGRNTKSKALKKLQLFKKKEQLLKNIPAPAVVNDEAISSENNNNLMKDVVHSSEVAKEANNSLDDIGKKINGIMTKYFDNTRTVNALNNNTKIVHNKNKVCKETKKNKDVIEQKKKTGKQKSKVTIEHDKDSDNEDHNNEIKVQNEESKENNLNKGNMVQNGDDTEHNNNVSTEQNKEENEYNRTKNEKNTDNNNDNREHTRNKKPNDQMKEKLMKQLKNKDTQTNKVSKQVKSQPPSLNLVFYLKDIARKCETKPIHTIEAITDTVVQIIAINGDKIKIFLNNFHSFIHVKANMYCIVCECPNVRRMEWHIAESEHRAKVMIPIKDRDGIRQLDDIWSHCILCNDLIQNVDFHLQSLFHKNTLKHCLVELGPDPDVIEDCNDIDKEDNDIKRNTSDKNEAIITALILKNYIYMTNKNYLNCNICNVVLNYDLISVKTHVNSFDHLNNFEQKMIGNNLVDIDEDRTYCIGCDVNIAEYDKVSHCKGKKHKKLLQEFSKKREKEIEALNNTDKPEIVLPSISQNIKQQSNGKVADSELICFICNIILYNIEEHMDSFDHKKCYYSYLEANKLNEIEADKFYCIHCNIVITIDYLMSHCTSRKHRVTLKNFVEGDTNFNIERKRVDNVERMLDEVPSTSQAPHFVKPSRGNDKTMPLKVLYQFQKMSDATTLLCTVCDEEVGYSRKLALYHVKTLDHIVAFNLIMLWNKIKKRDNKYFCDICQLDLTYFSEITHVFGKKHAINLAKEPKGTVYEYDRALVTHAYAMSHKVGDRIRPSFVISVAKPKKQ